MTLRPSATKCHAQRISGTWQHQQLGVVLERLTETASLELWLDRRVDPTQSVDTSFKDELVTDAISALAERHQLGVLRVGELVYVGPPKTTSGLAALLLRARKAADQVESGARKKWEEQKPFRWNRLTQPRLLLERLLAEVGVQAIGLEQVPLDLWPQRTFEPLPLSDQIVLVLVGFDLTCEISGDGKVCQIVPINFPLPDETEKLTVSKPQQQQATGRRAAKKLFSLKLENQQVSRVIEELATQLDLEIVWDPTSLAKYERSKDALVSCEVSQVDLDQLLNAILEPAGMAFAESEGKLTIRGVP